MMRYTQTDKEGIAGGIQTKLAGGGRGGGGGQTDRKTDEARE